MDAYALWCQEHGCTHGHCPWGCEHPQPVEIQGALCCRRCAVDGVYSVVLPCSEEICA